MKRRTAPIVAHAERLQPLVNDRKAVAATGLGSNVDVSINGM